MAIIVFHAREKNTYLQFHHALLSGRLHTRSEFMIEHAKGWFIFGEIAPSILKTNKKKKNSISFRTAICALLDGDQQRKGNYYNFIYSCVFSALDSRYKTFYFPMKRLYVPSLSLALVRFSIWNKSKLLRRRKFQSPRGNLRICVRIALYCFRMPRMLDAFEIYEIFYSIST